MADHTNLIQRLRDEGDLCANEIGSGGIATLLWEAAKALDVPPCSACDERAKAAAENAQWHADVAAGRKIVRDYVIEHMQPLYQVFNSPLAKSTCHKRRNDYCQCERKAALCDGAGPAVMSKSAPETNTSEGHVHVANMTKTARNGFIFAAKGAGLALPEGKYKLYIVKEGQ